MWDSVHQFKNKSVKIGKKKGSITGEKTKESTEFRKDALIARIKKEI